MKLTSTPPPPYYAVIFTSIKKQVADGYEKTAARMEFLAKEQAGFLGIESARDGIGITVSYWQDEASILKWKQNLEHLMAQQKGIKEWYSCYAVRVCKVERAYQFEGS
jgi:heme-degrading monooxygenase HmoA